MTKHRWLVLVTMGILLTPTWADVGPRPPIIPQEVKDPEHYLTMRAEEVDAAIDGKTAHVQAVFHFQATRSVYRSQLNMRLGFPEMSEDGPLKNVAVHQSTLFSPFDSSKSVDPPIDLSIGLMDVRPEPSTADDFMKGKGRWLTWPLTLSHQAGPPIRYGVNIVVSYDQDLTPEGKMARFTYVLRSGAAWSGNIGHAVVRVLTRHATVVSKSEGATLKGAVLTWDKKDFKPTEDVVLTVRKVDG